jgi:hypothetical protein
MARQIVVTVAADVSFCFGCINVYGLLRFSPRLNILVNNAGIFGMTATLMS